MVQTAYKAIYLILYFTYSGMHMCSIEREGERERESERERERERGRERERERESAR